LKSQHPVGQFAASQNEFSHCPKEQVAPLLQLAHWDSPSPHAAFVVPGWQTSLLSQQPEGQLKMQVEPVHLPLKQASLAGQDVQAAPPAPQSFTLPPVRHVPPASQQPVGHVEALHVETLQAPPVQLSPAGHAAQVFPPVPQSERLVPAWQAPLPSQQPLGQVAELHVIVVPVQTPPPHVSPGGQTRQPLPPLPQSAVLVPAWQFPLPSQHPVGQVIALHGDS